MEGFGEGILFFADHHAWGDHTVAIDEATVVRHRCHNERCVRPEHLIEGSAADNKRDDWDFWANGVDYDLL